MSWSRPALSVLIVPLMLGPVAAIPWPDREPALYFPVQFGTTWVYENDTKEETEVISGVRRSGGVTLVTISVLVKGETHPYQTLAVSEKGVARVELAGSKFDPPIWLLKVPAKPGDTWAADSTLGAIRLKVPDAAGARVVERTSGGTLFKETRTVVGEERVDVPAGSFTAVRVRAERAIAKWPPAVKTGWYARGVGLVKAELGGATKVLKSFSRGK